MNSIKYASKSCREIFIILKENKLLNTIVGSSSKPSNLVGTSIEGTSVTTLGIWLSINFAEDGPETKLDDSFSAAGSWINIRAWACGAATLAAKVSVSKKRFN